jgi:hypothetical protein
MNEKKTTIKMRVNVAGYKGAPASIFAAYDPASDILLVARESAYEGGERAEFLKITNQARDAAQDALFTEDDTRSAIAAYFELDALKLITLGVTVQRCSPDSKIERDGMDEHGMKYRIHPDISNAQVAVLFAALFAGRQRSVGVAQDFMDEMLLISI